MPAPIVPQPTTFHLPDLLELSTRMPVGMNPHYAAAAAESRAWVSSHGITNARKLAAVFAKGDFERLTARCFPYADKAKLRTLCDFCNLLFVIDEATDGQDGAGARRTADICLAALRDPSWDDGSALARIMQEFGARLRPDIGPNALRRFDRTFSSYLECVVEEAEHRERGEILDLAAYERLRRENSGCGPYYALIEYALGIDLPDDVYEDCHFDEFYWASVDMACYANDIYSYAAEYAQGLDDCNVVTVLMRTKGLSLQAASDYIGAHYKRLMDRYYTAKDALWSSSFGDLRVDASVRAYADAMDYWPLGNLLWSFETKRYFGDRNEDVRASLVVALKHPRTK